MILPGARGNAEQGRRRPRITLAAVAGAHGIQGEVRLKLFTDSADNLARHDRLYLGGVERSW